ncbi:MAG: hypothetical protein E6600_04325 [Anaerocolumna aminovalerica]|uniref:hypothetical protein n=1 Tax=Anaerocolumna aminovalerica TaxID=1527 RepID=UPI002911BEF7|nr:hypothetical protein [Anaerocolumna aminovalerica]MDU6263712.1 hypothetical protein [Anaerocolumna aminovalerica]
MKAKKVNIYRPEFIVESNLGFIGVPLAYIYWFIKCHKFSYFRTNLSKRRYWLITIPKFEAGALDA